MCSPRLKLMALTLRLGMPFALLRKAGRGASLNGFPNSVWEPAKETKFFQKTSVDKKKREQP
jgi:hypothetical protein